MIKIKTTQNIEEMKIAGSLSKAALRRAGALVRPGVSTAEIDAAVESFIRLHRGVPTFKGYGGFPGSICSSRNEEVVHGIPSPAVILQEGDIISIDTGATKEGWVGDNAWTFYVGSVSDEAKALCECTRDCLIAGIEQATSGEIILNGEDITALNVTERAKRGVAFAFQQPVKFKGINVLDLIRIAAGKRLNIADSCEYLSAVGLCARDYIDREINSSLSGGELKRIEIATVLARGASLSIFDEPEAGIDLWSFRNLIEVFERMRKTIHNSSIVIISHQERILSIADEIVVLKDGEIEKHGSRDEVFPELIRASEVTASCSRQ